MVKIKEEPETRNGKFELKKRISPILKKNSKKTTTYTVAHSSIFLWAKVVRSYPITGPCTFNCERKVVKPRERTGEKDFQFS